MTNTQSPAGRGFLCDCGRRVATIRIDNGRKKCDICSPRNLSGAFLRRVELENTYYAKDIIQPYDKSGNRNPEYAQVYGDKIYKEKAKQ